MKTVTFITISRVLATLMIIAIAIYQTVKINALTADTVEIIQYKLRLMNSLSISKDTQNIYTTRCQPEKFVSKPQRSTWPQSKSNSCRIKRALHLSSYPIVFLYPIWR